MIHSIALDQGLSNIWPGSQNQSTRGSNLAHCMALENVKNAKEEGTNLHI